ncbi:MAG: hypothetical protein A2020_16300 [Lentisphaerae bacterium GWF2_45_14]|nr:MAG: hypothetical protein A2020_16300 [Lentisphaerae bacterium GWF2_45_14]
MRKKLAAITAGLSIFATVATVDAEEAKAQEPAKGTEAKVEAATPATAAKVDEKTKWDFLPAVIATIGDKTITKEQFVKDMEENFSKSPMQMGALNPEMLKSAAPQIVNEMVKFMILQELAAKGGFTPSAELVEKEFDKMLASAPKEQIEAFTEQLKAQNMTMTDYKKKMSADKKAQEGIAVQKWVEENIISKIKVDEKEAKKFYEENKDKYNEPEQIKASHILIRPADDKPESKVAARKKAEEILAKITGNDKLFEELAAEESACPSGKRAKGDLGYFPKGGMVKEFEDAAFALEPGKISGIVETQYGYHIIKVTDKKVARAIPFEEAKATIEQQIKSAKIQEAVNAAIEKEKEALKVKINL